MPYCQIEKLFNWMMPLLSAKVIFPLARPFRVFVPPPPSTRSTSKTTLSSSGMQGGPQGMIILLDKLERIFVFFYEVLSTYLIDVLCTRKYASSGELRPPRADSRGI